MAEQRDNSGAIFKNDRKESDNHPDYKGSAMVGGVEYWVSVWINEARSTGQKYMAVKFNEKEPQHTQPNQPPQGGPAMDPGDIPFAPDTPRDW